MNRRLCKLVVVAGLLLPAFVLAQDDQVQAAVAINVEQVPDMWAGQQVTLYLDLKTTGFSFTNTHFNLPEVSGAFLMQTDTTTIKLTEKTDNRDWQIVRYPLALYPQKAGRIEIPPIDVRFATSAGFGKAEKDFEFQTRVLELDIKLPPGVNPGDMVITTSSFELDHNWQPATGVAKTGDAFTLTVNRRAEDISAMLLPPLPVFKTNGLASYPQPAEVNDKTDRGDLTGERVDSITWVVEASGQYTIPGIRFQWWDPARSELNEKIIPGLELEVSPAKTDQPVSAEAQQESTNYMLLLLILTGLLAVALWFGLKRIRAGQKQNNENTAFSIFAKACKENQAGQALSAIYSWLEHYSVETGKGLRPLTLGNLGRIANDEQLTAQLDHLQLAVVTRNNDWKGDDLLRSMQEFRRKSDHLKPDRSKMQLAPLNPQRFLQ